MASADDEQIAADCRLWKKHAPLLYDVVLTHSLQWPSLTCQWLPVSTPVQDGDYVEQKLLLGTHVNREASEEPNYLLLYTARLPSPDAELKVTDFNEEKGELGGYGDGTFAKLEPSVRINFPSEVNRARYCPANPFLIAAKPGDLRGAFPSGTVLLFDYSKHPTKPVDGSVRPLLTLAGHSKEGYGLAWSPVPGSPRLLSGSDDGWVCIWDVVGGLGGGATGAPAAGAPAGAPTSAAAGGGGGASPGMQPLFRVEAHNGVIVEDCAWHGTHAELFATVSDDSELRLWDMRTAAGGPRAKTSAHKHSHAMCVSFNPFREHLLATGGTDKLVQLWDARALDKPVHGMSGGHEGDVYSLAWCPFSESHLASSGQDRRVALWDTSRIGQEQEAEDAEDGPPELLVRCFLLLLFCCCCFACVCGRAGRKCVKFLPPNFSTLFHPNPPPPLFNSSCTAATATGWVIFPGMKRRSGSSPACRIAMTCMCGSPAPTSWRMSWRRGRRGRARGQQEEGVGRKGPPLKSKRLQCQMETSSRKCVKFRGGGGVILFITK
jgi:histone-binding protein RBBP4